MKKFGRIENFPLEQLKIEEITAAPEPLRFPSHVSGPYRRKYPCQTVSIGLSSRQRDRQVASLALPCIPGELG